jgi:NADH-quinone oxidoreductase subunit M
MMRTWALPWLLPAIHFLGAALSLLWWSSLGRMKIWALSTTVAALPATIALSTDLNPFIGTPMLFLVPLTAFLSLLGQPLHQKNRLAWSMTLVLMGLGLGILTVRDSLIDLLLAGLLGLLCWLTYRHQRSSPSHAWRESATYGLGMVSALLSLILPPSVSGFAALIACATLLPLVPLHRGFIAALTELPGNLPAFLALLLPLVGFHRVALLYQDFSPHVLETLGLVALIGACYGSLRAFAQLRAPARLAYGGTAFLCLLWWYLAETHTVPVHSTVYVVAVGLALSGLLLAWYSVRARYGDVDLKALGGMVYPMPRFSTLFALLALAALGMPPFGVFAGFMGMMLSPGFMPTAAFAVVVVVWFSASWYCIDLLQQVIFGRGRPDLRYEDLHRAESAALVTIVLLLLALGLAPPRFFQPGTASFPDAVATKAVTWP